MIKNFKWLLLVSLTFVACNDDEDVIVEEPVSAGSAVFSKYVALGDSFAAGFSDGALFIEAQKTAYPNILAQQFAEAGGGAFTTPFTADNIGGLLFGGNVIANQRLFFNGAAPAPVAGTPTTNVATKVTGPFGNLGVPGAKSFHLVAAGYGNVAGVATGSANPYYARFSTSATSTVLGDASAQAPTFFSLWIGGNDVLGFATSGGVGTNQTGNMNPATYSSNDITDPAVFASVYNTLVNGMTANGAKGVVANLPYVNTLPFFTTVPVSPLSPVTLGANLAILNAQLYGPLKQALTVFGAGDRINLLSATAANPLLIRDESLPNLSAQLTAAFTQAFTPTMGATMAAQTATLYGNIFGQARQTTSADLVLLTTQSAIGAAPTAANSGLGFAPPAPLNSFGISFPLQDMHVLIPSEIAAIRVATDAYNTSIKAIADAKGLAFVDAKAIMNQLSSTGIVANNFTMTSQFVFGGSFSLDGVHPSPRGYALISNAFIDAINAKYSSTLKKVDLGKYRILFPASL